MSSLSRRQLLRLSSAGATALTGCLRLESGTTTELERTDTSGPNGQTRSPDRTAVNSPDDDADPSGGTPAEPTATASAAEVITESLTENWQQFQYDRGHTGFVGGESLSVDTFEVLWRFETQERIAFSSPAVVDRTVYVASWDGHFYAVHAVSGEERWRQPLGTDAEWSSPTVVDDRVYYGSHNGSVYAFDVEDGETVWEFSTDNVVRCEPVHHGDRLFIGSIDGNLYALDPSSGSPVWGRNFGFGVTGVVVDDEAVYASGWGESEQVQAYSLEGDPLWETTVPGGFVRNSPTLANGRLYVGSDGGSLHALDPSSGSIEWTFEGAEAIRSSPGTDGERIYVGGQDNYLYAVDASTGEEQWRYWTSGPVRGSPIIAGDTVFVGSDGRGLHAVDVDTGRMRAKVSLNAFVTSTPAVINDLVFVGSEDYNLYALRVVQ